MSLSGIEGSEKEEKGKDRPTSSCVVFFFFKSPMAAKKKVRSKHNLYRT